MKKENTFLNLMGEIDERFVYEASLPWKKQKTHMGLKLLRTAAAGIAVALLIGGLSHTNEIKAAWNQITSWIQTALGIDENVESYIDSIGKTITKNGISITLDEIAADKENLWVALSDNINNSEEKKFILLTEVNVNDKPAQLDGTYDVGKGTDGAERQVYHYRIEDTTAKDEKADIKMNVWLADPEKMDDVDIEDTGGYVFEFLADWKELEKNTVDTNVNKAITLSPDETLTILKMSLNQFSSTIYGISDNKEYEDYYLIGTDNEGNQGIYRLTSYDNGKMIFEESRNDTEYRGISSEATSVTLRLYVNTEEKNKTISEKYETGIADIYGEGIGNVYEGGENPLDSYIPVGEKIEMEILSGK